MILYTYLLFLSEYVLTWQNISLPLIYRMLFMCASEFYVDVLFYYMQI